MTSEVLITNNDFTVELDKGGITHVILGPDGAMPVTGREGHAQIGQIWATLAANDAVRCILVRSRGKGFCAAFTGTGNDGLRILGRETKVSPRRSVVRAKQGRTNRRDSL